MKTEQAVRDAIETAFELDYIYASGGRVVYQTAIRKLYPTIDIELLCDVYADNLGDAEGTTEDYLWSWRREPRLRGSDSQAVEAAPTSSPQAPLFDWAGVQT